MAVVAIDGKVRVYAVSSISNIAAPTTTELNLGTNWHSHITPDGLDISPTTGKVNTSNLGSTFTTNKAGRRAFDLMVTLHRSSAGDDLGLVAYYGVEFYLTVRRGILATTAWTSGQELEVYPVQCGEPMQVKPVEDGTWDIQIPMYVTADPNTRASVA